MNRVSGLTRALGFLTLCAVTRVAVAQQHSHIRFSDFPVAGQFTGRPAPVILTGEQPRSPYSLKDLVVAEAARGPNFAGHFRLINASCGTSCGNVMVIDEITGRTYGGPDGICAESHRLHSDLLIVNPLTIAGESSGLCSGGPEYYRWVGHRFVRLDLADEPEACRTSLVSASGSDSIQLLKQYLASLPEEYPVSAWCATAYALVRLKATPSTQNNSALALVRAFVGRVSASYHPAVDSTTPLSDVATLQAAIRPYGLQLTRQGASYHVSEVNGWLEELFAGRLSAPLSSGAVR